MSGCRADTAAARGVSMFGRKRGTAGRFSLVEQSGFRPRWTAKIGGSSENSPVERIVYYLQGRRDHKSLEPRSGGRKIAQGEAEGETLGTKQIRLSPERAAGACVHIFMAVLRIPGFLETDCILFSRPRIFVGSCEGR